MNIRRAGIKTIQVLAGLAVLILIILWMSNAFYKKIEPGEVKMAAAKIAANTPTDVVKEEQVPVVEEASGTVEAKRKTIVSSRIMAAIREVKVRAGDEVTENEPLITLDDRDLAAHAQQAQRAVEAAQASATKAAADYKRAQELMSRNVIGRSEFEQAESANKIAQANLDSAQKAKQEADVATSFATINAPVAGRVVERYAEPGDTASPGAPLLAIYDPQSLRIEAPVRESLLSRVKVGDAIKVRLGDSTNVIEGKVGEIVPEAEAGSRTFLVKVDLPAGENIYTGMFARILIPAGERSRLVVSNKAIETIGQLDFVNVVAQNGEVSRRLATLGASAGDGRVEVLSGLDKGERVVLQPVEMAGE